MADRASAGVSNGSNFVYGFRIGTNARNYKQIRYRPPDIAYQMDFRNRDVVNIVIANILEIYLSREFFFSFCGQKLL